MLSKRYDIIKAEAEIRANQTCVKVMPKMNLKVNKERIKIRKNRQFTCGSVCVCHTQIRALKRVFIYLINHQLWTGAIWMLLEGMQSVKTGIVFCLCVCAYVRIYVCVCVWRLRGELINYKSRKFAYANLNCQHFWGVYERRAFWHAISWEKCHLQSHLYSQLWECAPHRQLTNPQ